MYRLVICDLDGTAATFDQTVRPAVRAAMQAVVDSGQWITISTGRGYQLLKPFLPLVVVNAPLVCCNGGLIVEPTTRRILFVEPMDLPLAHDLIRLAQRDGLQMLVYLDDMETMLEHRRGDPGFVLRRDGEFVGLANDPVAVVSRPPHKLIVLTDSPAETPVAGAHLQEYIGERARVLASSPQVLEVIMPGMSKAHSMSWLADYLGVKQEETVAIGDGDNDVEMLEWAGLGIAMGNATPGTRVAADWVAPPVEEDGLAVALHRFVIAPEQDT